MLELDDHNDTGRLDRNRDRQLRPRKHDGRVEQHEPDGHQRAVDTVGWARRPPRPCGEVATARQRDEAPTRVQYADGLYWRAAGRGVRSRYLGVETRVSTISSRHACFQQDCGSFSLRRHQRICILVLMLSQQGHGGCALATKKGSCLVPSCRGRRCVLVPLLRQQSSSRLLSRDQ